MVDNLLPQSGANEISVEHERLIALINNISDGVIAINQDQKVILANSVALELLDANSLAGLEVSKAVRLYDEKDTAVQLQPLIAQLNTPVSTRDWSVKYSDGSQASLFVSISAVHSGYGARAGAGWVMVLRDITTEKSLEEERNDFISVTSHELRTPIAVTEGNLSNALLLAEKNHLEPEIQQSIKAAHDQSLFLSNLINDLSMLSRADRGKLALSIDAFDAGKILKELAEDYQEQASQKGLGLDLQLDSAAGQLQNSELYVREILQNFITNALKYTEKGSITLSAKAAENGVVFSVADTGIGISKSDQNSLFRKFFRSDDWRVKKINGTGLGLYVTAKLIKLIGAKLSLESELNKGTKMEIKVPNLKQADQ